MKNFVKRLFSMLLVLAMVLSMVPAVFAQEAPQPEVLTEADYASADAVFAQIDAMEAAPAKKGASQTDLTDAAIALVERSEGFVPGSIERNGDAFTWWTTDGIHCAYNPRMRKIQNEMDAPENPLPDGIYNEPKATKGGWPSSKEVYLIGPYYGSDDSFTDQYKNEAAAIAAAIGDTDGYTLYSGTACTVDKVADAISNGAVVIFDSHGTTDWVDPSANEYDDIPDDYVTGATNSYLCLETKTGMTSEDYNDGALYGNGYAYINGAAIANHMTKNSPGGLLWMAICLGMATDTICAPMREMGVEVVYGYSQSVTFAGDYLYEETFWDNMIAGKDVATSIAAMKNRWGNWDWSTQIAKYYNYTDGYSTISAARADYSAFPVVVSDEDTHPGQRNKSGSYGADNLQTVKSTYTLYSQYAVTAQSNNTAYGTVSVNGSTVTAIPAEGYFAQSATVTSGTATVSQNGNTFSVLAESDCTVQINFAAKTPVTVSFSGANMAAQSGYAGEAMTLPTVTGSEYNFLGWMTAPLSSDTTEKPTFYTDSFIPAGNTTLYALYSYVDANSGTGTGDYKKVTESRTDWSGEYVIVYEDGSCILNGSLTTYDSTGNHVAVTITNDTIAAAEADAYKFTVEAVSGGYSFQGTSGKYFGHTGSKNTLDTSDTALTNTIAVDASGNTQIKASNYSLKFNSSANRFRYYTSGQNDIALYLKDGSAGTTYYTGSSTGCEHTNTTDIAAVAASCTEPGYTAGVQCGDCGNIISGHEAIPALGHSWGQWLEITAPGCETAGVETSTCSVCEISLTQEKPATGHSWGEWIEITAPGCERAGEQARECANCDELDVGVIPATGHDYTGVVTPPTAVASGYTTYTCGECGDTYTDSTTYLVSFSVPEGIHAPESMICAENGSITLPAAAAPEGYTFAGWTNQIIEDATEKPEIYAAGADASAPASMTLYALYTYEEAGEGGSGDYVKVTEAPTDWSGEYLIVYEAGNRIFDGSLTKLDAVSNYQSVTITDNTIIAAQGDTYKFTVAAVSGGYSIQSASGNYIGRSANSNGLDASTGAAVNTISLNSDGTVNIIGSGGAYLRYNKTSGQDRFRYFKSGSYTNQQAVALYKKDGAAPIIHYTTGDSAAKTFEAVSVVLNGTLGIRFYTKMQDGIVKIAAGDTQAQTVEASAESAIAGCKEYVINVFAEDMMTPITATLYTADGQTPLSTQQFTLADYVAAIQEMQAVSQEEKALADALLTYCQYAAKLQGKYSGSMNTLEPLPENAFADTAFPTVGPKGVSAYANLKDDCGLYLRLPEPYGEGYSVSVDNGEAELVQSGTGYVFGIRGILPQDYGTAHTFAIYQGETQVYSCQFSVLDYMGACMERNVVTEGDMMNLFIAMYHYYAAAKACVAAP